MTQDLLRQTLGDCRLASAARRQQWGVEPTAGQDATVRIAQMIAGDVATTARVGPLH